MPNYCSVQLKFNILGARSAHVRIQMNAIGDLRHQSCGESCARSVPAPIEKTPSNVQIGTIWKVKRRISEPGLSSALG